jgi:NAD(P)-dependent dehydrogenase (short-subunit alcohol dehydrogenase family)
MFVDMTNTTQNSRRLALLTGASRGLGRALAHGLADNGWVLILDARTVADLDAAATELGAAVVAAIPGDVSDPEHRATLSQAVDEQGGLDLLVANASTLGPSPQPALADYPLDELRRVYEVNVMAPLALAQLLIPALAARNGAIVNITSDASVEPYEGWGGYGSSKAALDQLTAILGAEQPGLRVYAVDPGDMRTQMHQDAFPGEDISDRPEPETVVPALLELLQTRPKNGRYRASDFLRTQATVTA